MSTLAVCPICKTAALVAVRHSIAEHALVAFANDGSPIVSESPTTASTSQDSCRCTVCEWQGPMLFVERKQPPITGNLSRNAELTWASMSSMFRYDAHDHEDSMELIRVTGLDEAQLLTALIELQARELVAQNEKGLWLTISKPWQ